MEINTKVKELEDEVKILKAEIRNILLDIREVILDKANPLGDEHEAAFIRMDLNTTARAMAAEAAMHEAERLGAANEDQPAPDYSAEPLLPDPPGDAPESVPDSEPPVPHGRGKGSRKGKTPEEQAVPEAAGSPVSPEFTPTQIPPMYRAPQAGSVVGLASWVAQAMDAVGAQQLDRIIAVHRLWGTLAPNVSEALGQLQELVRSCGDDDPRWLRVMRELDSLAAPATTTPSRPTGLSH